jgi:hypothetical protein
MTKAEAQKAIRHLCRKWYDTLPQPKPEAPSFSAFQSWLNESGYSRYLDFRSSTGAYYDAELWFDKELNLTPRKR